MMSEGVSTPTRPTAASARLPLSHSHPSGTEVEDGHGNSTTTHGRDDTATIAEINELRDTVKELEFELSKSVADGHNLESSLKNSAKKYSRLRNAIEHEGDSSLNLKQIATVNSIASLTSGSVDESIDSSSRYLEVETLETLSKRLNFKVYFERHTHTMSATHIHTITLYTIHTRHTIRHYIHYTLYTLYTLYTIGMTTTLDQPDIAGNTALLLSAGCEQDSGEQLKITMLLLNLGASVNVANDCEESILHLIW